jgi:hypothetical protein
MGLWDDAAARRRELDAAPRREDPRKTEIQQQLVDLKEFVSAMTRLGCSTSRFPGLYRQSWPRFPVLRKTNV